MYAKGCLRRGQCRQCLASGTERLVRREEWIGIDLLLGKHGGFASLKTSYCGEEDVQTRHVNDISLMISGLRSVAVGRAIRGETNEM